MPNNFHERNRYRGILPPVRDPGLINELAEIERFQKLPNSLLTRLALLVTGYETGDRWRAIQLLRHRKMPLPVSMGSGFDRA
jgi:hypothetical protein